MPCLRIPFQRLVQPVGNAAKLADRDGTRADFDIGGGTAARADAVEPVADMAAAVRQLEVARHGGRIDEQVGGIAADPVAADADFAVRSDECDTISAAFEAAVFDADAIGIPVSQCLAAIMAGWADSDRTALVGIHCPLDDIEMMGAPIGQDAAGIVAVGTPSAWMEAAVVRPVGGWAEPHVPIHPFRRRFGGKRAFGGWAADGDMGGNHFAEHAVADELNGRDEFATVGRTLLHTSLEDTTCAADFVDDVA